jgi:hypothetical protein
MFGEILILPNLLTADYLHIILNVLPHILKYLLGLGAQLVCK